MLDTRAIKAILNSKFEGFSDSIVGIIKYEAFSHNESMAVFYSHVSTDRVEYFALLTIEGIAENPKGLDIAKHTLQEWSGSIPHLILPKDNKAGDYWMVIDDGRLAILAKVNPPEKSYWSDWPILTDVDDMDSFLLNFPQENREYIRSTVIEYLANSKTNKVSAFIHLDGSLEVR